MKTVFTFFLFLMLGVHSFAQNDNTTVWTVECPKGQAVMVEGDLKEGKVIPLDWAASSQVACFPATRFVEFQGSHIFYRVELPRYSKLIATVKPVGKERINIYGIRQSSNASYHSVPPDISSASCEADYPMYAGRPNLKQGGETQDIELIAINNPYSILIGVAGAKDVMEGGFELTISIGDR